jgi:hypothetical protein
VPVVVIEVAVLKIEVVEMDASVDVQVWMVNVQARVYDGHIHINALVKPVYVGSAVQVGPDADNPCRNGLHLRSHPQVRLNEGYVGVIFHT